MKYVIEIEDKPLVKEVPAQSLFDGCPTTRIEHLYRAKKFNSLVFDEEGLRRLKPYEDELREAYKKGLAEGEKTGRSEAWEVARKLRDELKICEILKLFNVSQLGDVYVMPVKEVIAKLKAYEEQEIKIGDEVMCHGEVGIVYKVDGDRVHGTCNDDRDAFITFCWEKKLCRKTGRHFAKVAELKREVVDEPN